MCLQMYVISGSASGRCRLHDCGTTFLCSVLLVVADSACDRAVRSVIRDYVLCVVMLHLIHRVPGLEQGGGGARGHRFGS